MSCRFQPNYRGDAMLRGDADFRAEPCLDFTFDYSTGQYDPFDVGIGGQLIPVLPRLGLTCGQTRTAVEISDKASRSFYRTDDLVENQSYYARRFSVQADRTGEYTLKFLNIHGLHLYVTVFRSNAHKWNGPIDEDDSFTFLLDEDTTGPLTVEVTTISPYETGSFNIKLVCPGILLGYWPFDYYILEDLTGTILDSSVNGFDLVGDIFASAPGKVGSCLRFPNSSYFQANAFDENTFNDPASGFTVCGWFKTAGDLTGNGTICSLQFAGASYSVTLSLQPGGLIELLYQAESLDVAYPQDGDWHFIKVWYDGVRFKLQLDNGFVNESGLVGLPDAHLNYFQLTGTAALTGDRYYDEWGLWGRILTDTETAQLWNSGAGTTWPTVPP